MTAQITSGLERVRQIRALEAENAQLRRTAADLTAYVLALRSAVSGTARSPRQPARIGGGDSSGLDD